MGVHPAWNNSPSQATLNTYTFTSRGYLEVSVSPACRVFERWEETEELVETYIKTETTDLYYGTITCCATTLPLCILLLHVYMNADNYMHDVSTCMLIYSIM